MSKILSQDEVDALLKGMSGGEIEVETDTGPGADGVVVYDLTNQDRIIRGRMPTLEIINDRFARLFRTTLSSALRKIVDMTTTSVDMVKFGEFMRSLPVPTSLHIFKMDPLRGHAIFVLESKLVFNLVETFFGGAGGGEVKIEGRDFTAIEQQLTRKVVMMSLKDMEQAWKPVHELSLVYQRTEINPGSPPSCRPRTWSSWSSSSWRWSTPPAPSPSASPIPRWSLSAQALRRLPATNWRWITSGCAALGTNARGPGGFDRGAGPGHGA